MIEFVSMSFVIETNGGLSYNYSEDQRSIIIYCMRNDSSSPDIYKKML